MNEQNSPTATTPKGQPDQTEEKQHRSSLSKILDLSQYMRQDNESDVELIEKLHERIKIPEGWEEEEHLDEFRPAYWYRKGHYVVQYYAIMGTIAVILARAPEKEGDKKQDLTMTIPLIPPMEIPYLDEDGEEDWDNAEEKATNYFTEIVEYIAESDKSFNDKDGEASNNEEKGTPIAIDEKGQDTTPTPPENVAQEEEEERPKKAKKSKFRKATKRKDE